MLEVETIQTIHSSLTIVIVIDVSFLLSIHRYCSVNIAINRQFDVLYYSLTFLLPQRDPVNLIAQKWTGHYVRKEKRQVPVLAVFTDLKLAQ